MFSAYEQRPQSPGDPVIPVQHLKRHLPPLKSIYDNTQKLNLRLQLDVNSGKSLS